MDVTPEQLHILRHSLGLNDSGEGREYRNHFATDAETKDGLDCQRLCALGLMRDTGTLAVWSHLRCYTVTGEGVDFVRAHKHTLKTPQTAGAANDYTACPFCGMPQEEGFLKKGIVMDSRGVGRWFVRCLSCYAMAPEIVWNMRAPWLANQKH